MQYDVIWQIIVVLIAVIACRLSSITEMGVVVVFVSLQLYKECYWLSFDNLSWANFAKRWLLIFLLILKTVMLFACCCTYRIEVYVCDQRCNGLIILILIINGIQTTEVIIDIDTIMEWKGMPTNFMNNSNTCTTHVDL